MGSFQEQHQLAALHSAGGGGGHVDIGQQVRLPSGLAPACCCYCAELVVVVLTACH